MVAKQTILGPYKVRKDGEKWEVVEAVDRQDISLRPRCLYVNRQAAYGKMARLNRKYQKGSMRNGNNETYGRGSNASQDA